MRKTLLSALLLGTAVALTSTNFKINNSSSKVILQAEGEEFKGLPNDLNTERIVFLNMDSADVETEKPKVRLDRAHWNFKKIHNANFQRANKEMAAAVASYPFEFIVGNRSELESYKNQGFKYVLDYTPLVQAQYGIRETNGSTTVKYPVYIRNLENNDMYVLGYVADNFVYKYKSMVKKYVLNAVKSKFK